MKRLKFIKYIIIITNIILLIRLIDICINQHDYYTKLYQDIEEKTYLTSTPPRGRILDRKGNILVDNEGIKVLIYRMGEEKLKKEDIVKICSVVKIDNIASDQAKRKYFYDFNKDLIDSRVPAKDQEDFRNRLISADDYLMLKYHLITDEELALVKDDEAYIYDEITKGYLNQDKVLKVGITDQELTNINELGISSLRVDIKWIRKYNYDTALNDLFGSIGPIPSEEKDMYLDKGYNLDDYVGVSFLEKYYEDYLKGEKGIYQIDDNNEHITIKEEVRGSDLILGIDIDKQLKIEEALKEEILKAKKYPASKYYNGSYIIVSNPSDGGILAFVALKYDGKDMKSDTIGLLANSYTVGSAIKGASHTVAYKYGVLDEKTIMTDGCVKLYSQGEKCSWKSLGRINDIDALAYSSNYFQFINAIKVSNQTYKRNMVFNPTKEDFLKYRDIFDSYGLGVKSGIDLYEEQLGIKGDNYSGDLLLNLSIGQYDTYTPLMLNSYISTIANGGNRYKLRLAQGIIDKDGNYVDINPKELLNTIDLDPKYMERIRTGMHNVILKGTAMSYFNYKYDGAGKTGTSETYFENHGTYTNTFVGFVPYDNPEYAITIVSPNITTTKMYDYKYPINSRLSKAINTILFEK